MSRNSLVLLGTVMVASLYALDAPRAESALIPVFSYQSGANDARATFARLQQLVGTWEVIVDGRKTGDATYRITGGGRVLVEDMGGMLTTYHLDGDELKVTHYCGAGNQPRMRMTRADQRHVTFVMYDITNLSSPSAYHSTQLEVEFVDKDRVNLSYRGKRDGRESTQVFQLTRQT